MAMGMSYHEFWHGDYTQWKFIEEEYQIRKKEENEMIWLQGAYFYNAISAALANAFRGKGTPPAKYLEEPVRITPMTEDEKEAEKRKQVEAFRASLEDLRRRFEAKHKRERGELHGSDNC
jgi:hypothetical protein